MMGLSTDLLLLAAWLGVRQIWSWFPAVSEMCPKANGRGKDHGSVAEQLPGAAGEDGSRSPVLLGKRGSRGKG